jgi:hypothetical protein
MTTWSVERIENAMGVIAEAITLHNEPAYLPLFEMLEAELEKARSQGSKMDRIAQFAAARAAKKR